MVEITPRQKKILFKTVEEYIKTAQPVSSLRLNQKYSFNVSSATIRNEMMTLAKKGLLYRPYSSSGRVPTDKGYWLFVDQFLGEIRPNKNLLEKLEEIKPTFVNLLEFFQHLTRILNEFSSTLVLNYLFEKNLLWEEGWTNALLEPEFQDRRCIKRFTKLVEELETRIPHLFSQEPFESVKIFIGRNNPLMRCDDFSIIVSKIKIPKTRQGAGLVFLGPKRMPYKKNLQALYTLFEFIKKYETKK